MEYEEHEKRAWSVDFCRTDPSMLVSGSDDGKVSVGAIILACYWSMLWWMCIVISFSKFSKCIWESFAGKSLVH